MSGDIGKPMSGWERVRGVSSSQGSGQEVQESEEECDCQAYVRHVQGRRSNAQSTFSVRSFGIAKQVDRHRKS